MLFYFTDVSTLAGMAEGVVDQFRYQFRDRDNCLFSDAALRLSPGFLVAGDLVR